MSGESKGSLRAGHRAPRPPWWARLVDIFCVLIAALAIIVAITGGSRVRLGGWRMTVTSPYRLLLWAAAAAVVRHLVVPRPAIHEHLVALAAAWLRTLTTVAVSSVKVLREGARAPLSSGEVRLFEDSKDSRRRLAEWTAVFLGFSVLVAAFTWPQIHEMNSVADMGDPLFSIWRISWVNHQLPRNPSGLFDANIYYPERLTFTYSDPVLVPSLMGAPLFWLGLHRVVIYNVLLLSGFVFSGMTMYLLVRALTGRRDAAAVAGVVFTLHPYRWEHYSHLELQMTMWMPLALWALHRTMARARLMDGLVTGLVFALQMLSSLYYGMFFAPYIVVVGASLWIGRRFPLRPVAMLAAGVAIAGLLVTPVASQYVASRATVGEREPEEVKFFSAQGRDYLKPHSRSLMYERWSHKGFQERQLFPRIAPVALAFVGAWPPMSVASIAYTSALALTIDGSLGMNGMSFPWLREHVLGYRTLRAPARFSILGGMTVAVLCGYGAARLLGRWPRRRSAILLALLAPILIEALPNIALEPVWTEPPAIYERFTGQPPSVIAEFPTPEVTGQSWSDARYVYFSTFHWQNLVNGSSGFPPRSYFDFLYHTRDFPSEASLRYLRDRGVQYIAWHGPFTYPGRYRRTVEMLDSRSDLELVAAAPWQGSESRLYRFR